MSASEFHTNLIICYKKKYLKISKQFSYEINSYVFAFVLFANVNYMLVLLLKFLFNKILLQKTNIFFSHYLENLFHYHYYQLLHQQLVILLYHYHDAKRKENQINTDLNNIILFVFLPMVVPNKLIKHHHYLLNEQKIYL